MDTKVESSNSLSNQPPPTQSAKDASSVQPLAPTTTHSIPSSSTDGRTSAEASATKKYKTTNKPLITRDQYIDYDFSTIRDTKGGFLYDPKLDPQAPGSQFKDRAPILIKELPADIDGKNVPRCKVCQGLAIDPVFYQIFRLCVCNKCKREFPERFSLLTKTEVKEDYMLTEDELRDKDLFLSWSKPNPRKSNLRKRTRTDEWQQQRNTKFNSSGAHEHLFEESKPDPDNPHKQIQICSVCQLQVEVEEF
ncbi:DNA repair protein rad14 [Massospora cicadina]|nr:DNA repair protein rad14 [Massospora cicadina]